MARGKDMGVDVEPQAQTVLPAPITMPAMPAIMCNRVPLGTDPNCGLWHFYSGTWKGEPYAVTVRVDDPLVEKGYAIQIGSYSHKVGEPGEAFMWALLWQTAAYTAQSLEAALRAAGHPVHYNDPVRGWSVTEVQKLTQQLAEAERAAEAVGRAYKTAPTPEGLELYRRACGREEGARQRLAKALTRGPLLDVPCRHPQDRR